MIELVGFADAKRTHDMYVSLSDLLGAMRIITEVLPGRNPGKEFKLRDTRCFGQRGFSKMPMYDGARHRPQVHYADEPASSLDVSVQAQLLYLSKELQEEPGSIIWRIGSRSYVEPVERPKKTKGVRPATILQEHCLPRPTEQRPCR
jgi:hypothetical protein